MAAAAVRLAEKGWTRWLASNPGAMAILYSIMKTHAVDVAADWPLYVLNRNAGRALLETGCSCITASPEDDAENLRELSGLFGKRMKIVVHGDLPLFISAACAHLILGRCRTGAEGRDCPETGKNIRMNMEKNGQIEIIPSQCGSVVTAGRPFSLMDRLDEVKALGFNRLCVDWRWRPLAPAALAERWREFLAGRGVEGTAGNFHRGLL